MSQWAHAHDNETHPIDESWFAKLIVGNNGASECKSIHLYEEGSLQQ